VAERATRKIRFGWRGRKPRSPMGELDIAQMIYHLTVLWLPSKRGRGGSRKKVKPKNSATALGKTKKMRRLKKNAKDTERREE